MKKPKRIYKNTRATKNLDIYKQWRKSVITRDGGKCQYLHCKYKGKRIQVHHIKRYADFPQLRYTVSNGICLCPNHHKLIKNKEQQYEYLFSMIVAKKTHKLVSIKETCNKPYD